MSYTLKYTGSEIDDTLDRAVAGGEIDTELAGKQDALTFDDAPEAGSDNPVKSGGILTAIERGTVDTARAVLSNEKTTDTAPYLYRLNPHGNRVRPCIVGASVGANQLVDTVTTSVTLTSGHKYAKYASGAWTIGASDGTAITVDGASGDMLIDLTLRFGSAIADKAYEKEQATAGSGIAWLRSYGLLPEGYEAYNAGSIKSVNTSGRKTVGKNLFSADDVAIGSIGVVSNRALWTWALAGTYTFSSSRSGAATSVSYRLADAATGAWIDGSVTTLLPPSFTVTIQEGQVLVVWGTSDTTVDAFLAAMPNAQFEAGSVATAYEPYNPITYPTEATDLRGVFKLDGDTIYADGDLYPPSGEGSVKYDVLDLGSLTYEYQSNYTRFRATVTGFKAVDYNTVPNFVCASLVAVSMSDTEGSIDKAIGVSTNGAYIYVKYSAAGTDAAAVKTALNGVYLVYELATPTTASLTPYTEIQQALTTEEWLGSEVPVGQESEYYKDIVAAIEGIPEAPTANGTYTLTVTVSGGVATYSWEA